MSSQDERLAQVKRANERFYRAFESLDIDRMSAVWVHTERATCIHPGWELLQGWNAICQSWEAIFANTDYMSFMITDVSVHLYSQVAWVTCVENLSDTPTTLHMSRILTTNVFEYTEHGWYIVHHHASPVVRQEPDLAGLGPARFN